MANALQTVFADIADAIRGKTGKTDKIAPANMASEIGGITVGGSGGDSDGLVLPLYISSPSTTLGLYDPATYNVPKRVTEYLDVPEDTVFCGAYFTRTAREMNSSLSQIKTMTAQKFKIKPSDVTEEPLSNGRKKITLKTYTLTPTSSNVAYIGSYSAEGKILCYQKNAYLKDNIVYAKPDCKSLFGYEYAGGTTNPEYIEGIDMRGSQITRLAYSLNSMASTLKKVWCSEVMTVAPSFTNCSILEEIHFTSLTPPVVSNHDAFVGIPTTCKIYVPAGTLDAYKSASNYPSPTTYTYVEE